jgi:hypothetical protein
VPYCFHHRQAVLVGFLSLFTIAVGLTSAETTSTPPVPNGDLTQGDTQPQGWTLSGGKGRWVDRHILEVTGSGGDSNLWRCDYSFAPGALYRMQMRARCVGGAASAMIGPDFANFDYPFSDNWTWSDCVFRAQDDGGPSHLRFGQWQYGGSLQLDAVQLSRVLPVYQKVGSLQLGEGESIKAGHYRFDGQFGTIRSNFHRPLVSSTAFFNTDRWCFGGKLQVTYRFGLPGYAFRSGKMGFVLSYWQRGSCLAEISRDQKNWRTLTTRDKLGIATADVPADLLPAGELYIRLRCATEDSNFHVNLVGFEADLNGAPPDGIGKTCFADVVGDDPNLAIENAMFEDSSPHHPRLSVTVRNRGQATQAAFSAKALPRLKTEVFPGKKSFDFAFGPSTKIVANEPQTLATPATLKDCGSYIVQWAIRNEDGHLTTLTVPWTMPNYYEENYGERIAGATGNNDVWWCEATWKVSPKRAAPSATGAAATLSAARNDAEAMQIVVRPRKALKQLTAAVGALQGPNGATIPATSVELLQVYYHDVQHPTDGTSVRGEWPDALPPLDKPIDVPAEKNQPIWVLIHVPKDAPAGDYSGQVTLKAEGWTANVPVKLHVWNFALPEKNHLETAFGFNVWRAFDYQNVKDYADRRKVLDQYLQCLSDHRISPYCPAPLEPIGVKFVPDANPPRTELDFRVFDAEMARVLPKYHFTNFMLQLEGMGGGTFQGRSEGQIGKYGEHTPQYQAMFSSYLKQLESHLREKGWLDMAYTYWFDEPEPKDYEFVKNGMERIKKNAPGIATMLTEQPEQALAGNINIWCAISDAYNQAAADARRAKGERFWWYVCCGPRAPYCTLFIDHPATDLRVWLWQTWQRNISGILIWDSNYWTSQDNPKQNPYADPMGYVSGTQPKDGQYWGNGDGRFIYPPLAAAGGVTGNQAVMDRPVSSIRWEMLREGIEDYEYLWLLRDLIAKKRNSLSADQIQAYESLLAVPKDITVDATTFTADPRPIYAQRTKIAEAIEQLVK